MGTAKYNIRGSDYVGVFAAVTDRYLFIGRGTPEKPRGIIAENLAIEPIEFTVSGTELIGLFARANKNGILISALIEDYELEHLNAQKLGINIGVLKSGLNAIGNNILANDKIALVNPEYSHAEMQQIKDVLGVEVIKAEIGGFKTIGANNILTNKGMVINNRAADVEKDHIDKLTGFNSVRTTANTGSLSVGLSAVANSNGLVAGDTTTGYELARIMDALDIA